MLDAVCAVLRRPGAREPIGQARVVIALLQAMGGLNGHAPSLVDIATKLGLVHQTVYRRVAVLEAKGVVRRAPRRDRQAPAWTEIRL